MFVDQHSTLHLSKQGTDDRLISVDLKTSDTHAIAIHQSPTSFLEIQISPPPPLTYLPCTSTPHPGVHSVLSLLVLHAINAIIFCVFD